MNSKIKTYTLILSILLIFGALGGGYWYLNYKNNSQTDTNKTSTSQTSDTQVSSQTESKGTTPLPEFQMHSSKDAINATFSEALKCASDAQLYSCSGLTLSSYKLPDITYHFVGADKGKYKSWTCDYYSSSRGATKTYIYNEGKVDSSNNEVEIGEYMGQLYNSINYPADPTTIIGSDEIYAKATTKLLDPQNNYFNMYLGDTADYGYVWHLEELSKTEKDKNDINILKQTIIFDPYTGNITQVTTDSIY